MKICVVALGKIGVPLAVQFASRGHEVIGTDVDPQRVDLLNQGLEPFPGEAQLAEKLRDVHDRGLLMATNDTTAAVAESDVVVVVVPVSVDQDSRPDFEWMDNATRAIGRGLTSGTLVSYETTLPVGTTRTRYAPMLEQESGLVAGRDFYLVFSPERVLTGRVFADLRKYPKLVGGVDPGSEQRGIEFYEAVLEFDDRPDLGRANGVWPMGSAEAAEMAKLAETTYRDVNIGLANQFARYADGHGIDVLAVIEACNSQPFSHIHRPGIAVGGHCIPVYPRLYLHGDPEATVVSAARDANASMPAYAITRLVEVAGSLDGARVVVLGASYRGGVQETAMSGVFPVVAELTAAGAEVLVHDPLHSPQQLEKYGWTPYQLGTSIDVAVVQADHDEYRALRPADLPGVHTILDGRNMLAPEDWPGVRVIRIGQDGQHSEGG